MPQRPPAWFSGEVWLDDCDRGTAGSLEGDSRLVCAWSAHGLAHSSLGQALHVVSGIGWVQLKGDPPKSIRSGDSVWIEPEELHWHGAAADRTMVHIAIQNADEYGMDVVWLEHVTEAEYNDASPPMIENKHLGRLGGPIDGA